MYGIQNEPIRYVVHPEVVPNQFASQEEERMFQIPLVGTAFDSDNRAVYRKLKAFLINTPGWAWIEPFNGTEMEGKLSALGPITTMVKANSASVLPWRSSG